MKILILGVMNEEVDVLKQQFTFCKRETYLHLQFCYLTHHDFEIILVATGVGKVNAAMVASIAIERHKPNWVLHVGCAGAISPKLQIGDVVLASSISYFDVDLTAFHYRFGQLPKMPQRFAMDSALYKQADEVLNVKTGLIVSGDRFVDTINRIKIIERFPDALAVDMESAAVAQVCFRFQLPVLVLRVISDNANSEAHNAIAGSMWQVACKILRLVEQILQQKQFNTNS